MVEVNNQDITLGIEAGDLIRIDFNANKIDRNGMYVITLNDAWIGYRRFSFKPISGTLHIEDPLGDVEVSPSQLETIKVVGRIKNVYRPNYLL